MFALEITIFIICIVLFGVIKHLSDQITYLRIERDNARKALKLATHMLNAKCPSEDIAVRNRDLYGEPDDWDRCF